MAEVTIGGRTYHVEIRGDVVAVDGHEYPVKIKDDGEHLTVTAGGVPYRVQLPPEEERQSGMALMVDYRPLTIAYEGHMGVTPTPKAPPPHQPEAGKKRAAVKGGVAAQIAGRIIRVLVKPGDAVKQGDVLLLLEAMKMENEVKATADGVVKEVLVTDGQRVTEGETLVVVE